LRRVRTGLDMNGQNSPDRFSAGSTKVYGRRKPRPPSRQNAQSFPWQRYGIPLPGERKWVPDTQNALGRKTRGRERKVVAQTSLDRVRAHGRW